MRPAVLIALALACSGPTARSSQQAPPSESAPAADPAPASTASSEPQPGGTHFADPPPPAQAPTAVADGTPLPAGGGGATGLHYLSDCSLTHPIARDPCSGAAPSDRGLRSCASLGVARGQACASSSPSCTVARTCPDGHQAIADFLVCADKTPERCFTRSSRRYKNEVTYLSAAELRDLARQIQALPLATFRYKDQVGGRPRLGFVTEDAPAAPFVSADGSTVDLYALLAASIAAIQAQDARIRALEEAVQQCRVAPPR